MTNYPVSPDGCLRLAFGQRPIGYNGTMKRKPLSQTNPHLRDAKAAKRRLIRSIASSTAIETGESVQAIEEKLRHLQSSPSRVRLA